MKALFLEAWRDWRSRSRYREVSRVCVPLVTGMAATTVMEFTDRIFLSHYSVDAISAVVPAGVIAFLLLCFLGGVSGYVSVFIAQYYGSGRPEKIGSALWQGLFFTFLSGLFLFFSLSLPLLLFSPWSVTARPFTSRKNFISAFFVMAV